MLNLQLKPQDRQSIDFAEQERIRFETNGSKDRACVDASNLSDENIKSWANKFFPEGSIYLSVKNTSPASLFGGTWEALSQGYALWTTTTDNEGGKTINAGLPNITGSVTTYNTSSIIPTVRGAFTYTQVDKSGISTTAGTGKEQTIKLDASKGEIHSNTYRNDVYGKSDTVQPPAIKVFAWKRIS